MENFSIDFISDVLGKDSMAIQGKRKNVFMKFSEISQADGESAAFCKYAGEKGAEILAATRAAIVLCSSDVVLPARDDITFVVVDNPRLCFARLVAAAYPPKKEFIIHETAIIGNNCRIGKVAIGAYVVIGDNVVIGDGTMILPNVTIGDNVRIGCDTIIKSNTTIGQKGFGFEFDSRGIPFTIPHIGGVTIGNDVEIGAQNTVARGTLKDTVIGDHVKIDDHVHVAHNVIIGERTVITACVEISGSVTIEEDCYLGPNCSIMNKITIGRKALIGLGAVVLKSVPANAVVVGNPAKFLRNNE